MGKPCAQFYAPIVGGWGIVRTALLVPESVLLFVSPHSCGRHASVSSILTGTRARVYYLDVTENDIVFGGHVERIGQAVEHILATRVPRPPAFFICATCIDDLLGTDYDALIRDLSVQHGLPFALCRMNPISLNSSVPPSLGIQRSIHSFLLREPGEHLREPEHGRARKGYAREDHAFGGRARKNGTPEGRTSKSRRQNDSLNLIGHVTPIQPDSEFFTLMARAGFERVRQLSACTTFAEYLKMRDSGYNLLIKPLGRIACEDMEKGLGIPWHTQLLHYHPEAIRRSYEDLRVFLEKPIPYLPCYEQCRAELRDRGHRLKGLTVGVGANVNGSPFEIALTLAQGGLRIAFIVCAAIANGEWEYLEQLKALCGDIPVYTNFHPSMAMIDRIPQKADVAIGFDAAHICPSSKLFVLDNDVQFYGFAAATALFAGVEDALSSDVSAKALLFSKGLVV